MAAAAAILSGCYGTVGIVVAVLLDDPPDGPENATVILRSAAPVVDADSCTDTLESRLDLDRESDGALVYTTSPILIRFCVVSKDSDSEVRISYRILQVESPRNAESALVGQVRTISKAGRRTGCDDVHTLEWNAREAFAALGVSRARVQIIGRARGSSDDLPPFWLDLTEPPAVVSDPILRLGTVDEPGEPMRDAIYGEAHVRLELGGGDPDTGAPRAALFFAPDGVGPCPEFCAEDLVALSSEPVTTEDEDPAEPLELFAEFDSAEVSESRARGHLVVVPFSTRVGEPRCIPIEIDNRVPRFEVIAPSSALAGVVGVAVRVEHRSVPEADYLLRAVDVVALDPAGEPSEEFPATPALGGRNEFFADVDAACAAEPDPFRSSRKPRTYVWNAPRDVDAWLARGGAVVPPATLRVTIENQSTGRIFARESNVMTYGRERVGTVAGGGSQANTCAGKITFSSVADVAFANGSVFAADDVRQTIHQFELSFDCAADEPIACQLALAEPIRVFAGDGFRGFDAGSLPATLASFDTPSGLAAAPDGRIYIADSGNDRVRFVDPETQFLESFPPSGGVRFDRPRDVAVVAPDPATPGRYFVYVADTGGNRVVRIDPLELEPPEVAATLAAPRSLAGRVEAGEVALYVAESAADDAVASSCGPATAGSGRVVRIARAAGGTYSCEAVADFPSPIAVAVAGETLFVADEARRNVFRVGADGTIEAIFADLPALVEGFACAPESGGGVRLSWDVDDPSARVLISRDPGFPDAPTRVAELGAGGFEDADAPPGVYTYSVQRIGPPIAAIDCDAEAAELASIGEAVTCLAEVAPRPVRDLSCARAASAAELTWTNDGVYDEIRIVRRDSRGVVSEVVVPGDAARYVDSTATRLGASYSLRGVRAEVASDAVDCELTEDKPPAPSSLVCIAGATSVELAWMNAAEYDRLTIRRESSGRDDVTLRLPGSVESYIDAAVPPGAQRYFVAGSIDGIESDETSCEVVVDASTPSVRDLAIDEIGAEGTVRLRWSNAPGGYDSILLNRFPPLPGGSRVLDGESEAFEDVGAEPNLYRYRVEGIRGSERSVPVSVRLVWPVENLACRGDEEVELRWSNPSSFSYDSIVVTAESSSGRTLVYNLPGSHESITHFRTPTDAFTYIVRGVESGESSPDATCVLAANAARGRAGGMDVDPNAARRIEPRGLAAGPCDTLLIAIGSSDPLARRQVLVWDDARRSLARLAGLTTVRIEEIERPGETIPIFTCEDIGDGAIEIAPIDEETAAPSALPIAATEAELAEPARLALESAESGETVAVYVSDAPQSRVVRADGCTGVLTEFAAVDSPGSIATDGRGSVYVVASSGGRRVVRVLPGDSVLEFAEQPVGPVHIAWDPLRERLCYATDWTFGCFDGERAVSRRYSLTYTPSRGGALEVEAVAARVDALAIDRAGDFAIAGRYSVRITDVELGVHTVAADVRVIGIDGDAIDTPGEMTARDFVRGTYASTCDLVEESRRDFPSVVEVRGLAFLPGGDLVLAERTAEGQSFVYLVSAESFAAGRPERSLIAGGALSPADPRELIGVDADGSDARVTLIPELSDLETDALGNVYFTQLGGRRVRRFSPDVSIAGEEEGGDEP